MIELADISGQRMIEQLDKQSPPPVPRLWFDRHYRRRGGHRRLVMAASALVAMAVGAGLTLAFTQPETGSPQVITHTSNAMQVAASDRQHAAGWIAREVASNIVVACDLEMCNQLQK